MDEAIEPYVLQSRLGLRRKKEKDTEIEEKQNCMCTRATAGEGRKLDRDISGNASG